MTRIHSQAAYRKTQHLEQILSQHMALWGYEKMTLPIIEPAAVFLTRAGDTTISKLFTFERHGKSLALRPEFTASAAHHYATNTYHAPVRWQFSGAIFADDPNDVSLQYQTHSIGAELIGQVGIMADAEVMSMAALGIQKLGIDAWQLVSGHVGLQRHLLAQFALDRRLERMVLAQRDALKHATNGHRIAQQSLIHALTMLNADEAQQHTTSTDQHQDSTERMLNVLLDSTRYGTTMGGRSRQDIAQRLLHKHDRTLSSERLLDALDFFTRWVAIEDLPVTEGLNAVGSLLQNGDTIGYQLLNDWRKTIELLNAHGIDTERIRIQANLTRNWEYYTGIVFGVQSTQTHDFIVGGGRYDELVHLLGGGASNPAVGFGYYIDPLLKVMPSAPQQQPVLTLAVTGHDAHIHAIRWAQALRDEGIATSIAPDHADHGGPIVGADGSLTYEETAVSLDQIEMFIQAWKATTA